MHYQKFFEGNKLNLRKSWEGIREVINIKKTEGQIINAINNDEDTINENNKIAGNPTTISAKLQKQQKTKYLT